MEDSVSYGFAILVGFSLSAACGMRIFAPLAIVSIATHFGWVNLGGGFAWIGSMPAVVCFAFACVVEILGMLIPWLDHVLDVAGAPVAAVAGTVVMASQLAGTAGMDTSSVPQWVTWAMAATGVHAAAGTLRIGSTTVSGGLLNPIFAIVETLSSFILAGLAVLLPIVAVIVAIVMVISLGAIALAVLQWRKRLGAAKTVVAAS